jgi:hypothetical protein
MLTTSDKREMDGATSLTERDGVIAARFTLLVEQLALIAD